MATKLAGNRIAERKLRDRQARRAQIICAARRIAELEGWSNVTLRRLSDEISYSQPVLYAHFGSRDWILAAVAIEGSQELGMALEKARKRVKRGGTVESVAAAYLEFAASSPALYEVMFTLGLSVPLAALLGIGGNWKHGSLEQRFSFGCGGVVQLVRTPACHGG